VSTYPLGKTYSLAIIFPFFQQLSSLAYYRDHRDELDGSTENSAKGGYNAEIGNRLNAPARS